MTKLYRKIYEFLAPRLQTMRSQFLFAMLIGALIILPVGATLRYEEYRVRKSVPVGTNTEKLIEVMGEPDRYIDETDGLDRLERWGLDSEEFANHEKWVYYLFPRHFVTRHSAVVVIEDDRVIEIGFLYDEFQ